VKRDVLYARVSSEEQKRNETVKGQIEEVRKHAATKGVTIDQVYVDEGISGSTALSRRPAGAELLRDAEAGSIQRVYLWKYDRVSRNLKDFLVLHDLLERYGVTVVSITQPLPEGPAGKLMLQMLGAFAELDRNNIRENMMRGQLTKVQSGGYRGGPVKFGYKAEGVERNAKIALHPQHAALVRWIFTAYDRGKSCSVIADDLNRRAVATPRGAKLWRASAIGAILRDPVYVGAAKYNKRQWTKGADNEVLQLKRTPERAIEIPVPAIVSQELFHRVQRKLSANQLAKMAHAKNEYLLRQKITCGLCGKKYVGRGRHYSCAGRHCAKRLYGSTREACKAPTVRRDAIEAAVWEKIAGFLKRPGSVLRALEKQLAIESHPLRLAEQLREAEKERSHQQKRLDRIAELFIDGELTKERRQELTGQIAVATAALESRILDLRRERASLDTAALGLEGARDVLGELSGIADAPSPAQRRRAVEALLESVVVDANGKCKISFLFQPEHVRIAGGYAPASQKNTLPSRSTAGPSANW
jgi:site-specific DNA recombinase